MSEDILETESSRYKEIEQAFELLIRLLLPLYGRDGTLWCYEQTF